MSAGAHDGVLLVGQIENPLASAAYDVALSGWALWDIGIRIAVCAGSGSGGLGLGACGGGGGLAVMSRHDGVCRS